MDEKNYYGQPIEDEYNEDRNPYESNVEDNRKRYYGEVIEDESEHSNPWES